MLKKSKISKIEIGSEIWKVERLGKFTSSNIWKIMGDRGFGETGLNYIKTRVGECMTGISSEKEFLDNDSLRWGLFHEAEAVNKFGLSKGLPYIVCQKLIVDGDKFGGTPDGIIVLSESPDELEYKVETLEVKCPPTYDNYITLFLCETTADLKRFRKEYYWQVLDQMLLCESIIGYFMCYHPDFKSGNMNVITFNRMYSEIIRGSKKFPIHDDIKLLKERKGEAVNKFNEIKQKLLDKDRF